MILRLNETCPVFARPNHARLHDLLLTVEGGWHVIAAPRPEHLRLLLPGHLWTTYGELLTRRFTEIPNSRHAWMYCQDCDNCDARSLTDFLRLPLRLIVENVHTDGAFVHTIARLLRPDLRGHLTGPHPRVEIVNGGGSGELPKAIEKYAGTHRLVRPAGEAGLGVMVLVDSDARKPGESGRDTLLVCKAGERHDVAVHVLRKRSIENYVPDEALHAWAKARRHKAEVVRLLASLAPEARDHYPMKDGLTSADVDTGLYPRDVPLGEGLGDFFLDLLKDWSHELRAVDLARRDGCGELNDFLARIERML